MLNLSLGKHSINSFILCYSWSIKHSNVCQLCQQIITLAVVVAFWWNLLHTLSLPWEMHCQLPDHPSQFLGIKLQHWPGRPTQTHNLTFSCKVRWVRQASPVLDILQWKVTLESQTQAVLSLFCQVKHGVLETRRQVLNWTTCWISMGHPWHNLLPLLILQPSINFQMPHGVSRALMVVIVQTRLSLILVWVKFRSLFIAIFLVSLMCHSRAGSITWN